MKAHFFPVKFSYFVRTVYLSYVEIYYESIQLKPQIIVIEKIYHF